MKFLVYIAGLLAMVLVFSSCGNQPKPSGTSNRGFYFWETTYYSSPQKDSLIGKLGINKIYTKIFEVDWDPFREDVVPVGSLNYFMSDHYTYLDSIEYIPVVYITNESFLHLNDSQVIQLANRITKRIKSSFNEAALFRLDQNYRYDFYDERYYWNDDDPYRLKSKDFNEMQILDSIRHKIEKRITEIQFDCDWTDRTKDKYFLFLTEMKRRFQEYTLSSTIRLYQYKYFEKSGVPPVDKGMLMCYNTGDIRKVNSPNTIFKKSEVMKYLNTNKPYPLMLDYALPLFEWVAVYRNKEIVHLISPERFYFDDVRTFKKIIQKDRDIEQYEVLQDVSIGYGTDEILIKENDLVKLERPNLTDVAAIASKLRSLNKNPDPTITLFDFDYKNVQQNEKYIQKIFSSF